MQTQTLTIINKLGLHARASGKFVQTAAQGSQIQIEADGADEAQAVQALTALINDYFGEGE